jgi:hypothetical protein
MKTDSKRFSRYGLGLFLLVPLILAGCAGRNVERMKEGLVKTGLPADQAECYAREMSKTVNAEPYNYMAELMIAGADEKSAVNKARRKYTADFKDAMEKARAACVR